MPRTARYPLFIEREDPQGRRYPRRMEIDDVRLNFRLSRLSRLDNIEDEKWWVRRRELFGWMSRAGARIGALEFVEYQLDWVCSGEIFADACDSLSGFESEAGRVIVDGWPEIGSDIGAYGSIVHFESVWLTPLQTLRWAALAQKCLDELFPEHVLLVIKAFPLEHEGNVAEDTTGRFERRRRAMLRHYSRLLGVQSFPAPHGDDGWMWRIHPRLAGIIDPPVSIVLPDEK